jgi:hypothetical protein
MVSSLRYYATILGKKYELFPNDLGFSIEWAKQDDWRGGYTPAMKTKLVFHNKQDYQNLLAQEQSAKRCTQIPVEIRRTCDGLDKLEGEAYINLNDGEWDLDKCTVELELRLKSEYDCLDDHWEEEINLFSGATQRYPVRLMRGTLEFLQYTASGYGTAQFQEGQFPEPSPANKGWAWYKFEYIPSTDHSIYYYVREKFTGAAPSGADWVLISGTTYARKPSLYDYRAIGSGNTSYPATGGYATPTLQPFEYSIFGTTSGTAVVPNGIKLADVLQYFVNKYCAAKVVSDFFQINPETATAINYVTNQTSTVRNIFLFNKSDVKRPNALSKATILNTTFKDLLEALCKMFNLRYKIESGIFRIEHVSHGYYTKPAGLDVTTEKYKSWLAGKRKYSYDKARMPKREVFTMMEANGTDFIGAPISYTSDCLTAERSQKDFKVEINNVTTDLWFVLQNGNSESTLVNDKGIFMMACDYDGTNYFPITLQPILDTEPRMNNALSLAHLHDKYHRHNRFQQYGFLNYALTTFLSTQHVRKGETFIIPWGCGDVLNLNTKIITPLGEGIVESATLDLYACTLELELSYPDVHNTTVTCLKPSKFVFDHITGNEFFFDVTVQDQMLPAEVEAVYPTGEVRVTLINFLTTGIRSFFLYDLVEGDYKFRIRIRCGTEYSAWTDYTQMSYVPPVAPPPPTCPALLGALTVDTAMGGQGYYQTSFGLIYDDINGDLGSQWDVEVSQPQIQIINGQVVETGYTVFNKAPSNARTVGTKRYFWVNVGTYVTRGKWRFRIRKICSTGQYSEFTPYLIIKVT